ncbi:MAG TPA: hypothetical protein VI336_03495 [Candidatus Saccharimonadales bacterium]|nr:hypothetical protein [Candidatus Saccharimonadales bacterium]
MRSVFTFIRKQIAIVFAVLVSSVVGGATTAVVMAAIPDSSGVIHGCIRPNNNNLRVIDTEIGETCTVAQTPISWDKDGTKAYAHILEGGTLDTGRSKNVAIVEASDGDGGYIYCLDISVPVNIVNVTPGDDNGDPGTIGSVDPNFFDRIDSAGICSSFPSTDAIVLTGNTQGAVYLSFN